MPPLVLNTTNSEFSIRDFYQIGNGGYYGSVCYKLKPNNGYKVIYHSYFEQLSKTMFAPLEIRVCRGGDGQFIAFSPLEIEFCDGIVISIDDDDKLAAKCVGKTKVYAHEWLRYWFPELGVKERIQYILSIQSTEHGSKTWPSHNRNLIIRPDPAPKHTGDTELY